MDFCAESGHHFIGGYPLRAPGFHVRYAPGNFFIPGFGNSLRRFFGLAFETDDQAMDQFAAFRGDSARPGFPSSSRIAAMMFCVNTFQSSPLVSGDYLANIMTAPLT